MAKASRVAMSTLPGGLALLLALLLGVLSVVLLGQQSPCGAGAESNPSEVHAETRQSAEELYPRASGLGHEGLEARMKAARMLAKQQGAESWIVLLLLSSQTAPKGDEIEQERQKVLHPFELAVVAEAVKSLPKQTGPPVLWALTFLLNEEGRGRWSEKSILQRKSEHKSRPIRELARQHLKDRLGIDHGWDASAWRTSIVERAKDQTPKGAGGSTTATRPARPSP